MMNLIFAFLFLSGIIAGMIFGRGELLSAAVFEGASDAVSLLITLLGSMCFWGGVMKVAEKSGAVDLLGKVLSPVTKILFPKLKRESAAMRAIVLNMSANILGLSNAATPMGIRAMGELQKRNRDKTIATDEMIMLVVINTASLQLIPSNLLSLRIANRSAAPFEIVPAVWMVSVAAILCGVMAVFLLRRLAAEGKK